MQLDSTKFLDNTLVKDPLFIFFKDLLVFLMFVFLSNEEYFIGEGQKSLSSSELGQDIKYLFDINNNLLSLLHFKSLNPFLFNLNLDGTK